MNGVPWDGLFDATNQHRQITRKYSGVAVQSGLLLGILERGMMKFRPFASSQTINDVVLAKKTTYKSGEWTCCSNSRWPPCFTPSAMVTMYRTIMSGILS